MKNIQEQKGITLIALIITIIVMLILVGVTINVALNGGLFEKAREASTKMQRETEREELVSIMIGAYNNSGKFDINNAINNLPDGVKWCTNNDTIYAETTETIPSTANWRGAYVITDNNNRFYIDENGSVLDERPGSTLARSPLVYNTAYSLSGTDIYFFQNCGKFIMKANEGNSATIGTYTYNATTGEVVLNGIGSFTLSEDATSATDGVSTVELVPSNVYVYNNSKMTGTDVPNLYYGAYYNDETEIMIIIEPFNTGACYYGDGLSVSASSFDNFETILNNRGITIKDETTLQYGGNDYSLVSSL